MLDNLESNYDCADAGGDLHELQQEWQELQGKRGTSRELDEKINRLENQIRFIKNKCDIR